MHLIDPIESVCILNVEQQHTGAVDAVFQYQILAGKKEADCPQ